MIFDVDLHSPKPIYQQLIDQMKLALATGRLRAGDKLPSIRDVAVELRVNRNTVARVYADLEREGLIYTRAGQGCFASDRGGERLSDAAIEDDLRKLLDAFLAQARVYRYPRSSLVRLFEARMKELYPDEGTPTKDRRKGDV
ncbi:GntR family transcriptional regulator [bacterium]|nr:GntR family transcriptional regulator [bacterium]